jgi:rifampin ADP-ribosylating transferase
MPSTDNPIPERFNHGTRADLKPGDRIARRLQIQFRYRKPLSWVYFTGTLDAAIWGAELASGSGRERIYIVAPIDPFVDDPNLTDKKFPGNPTQSYRSREPLLVIGAVTEWQGHVPERLQQMKDNVARLSAEGAEIID